MPIDQIAIPILDATAAWCSQERSNTVTRDSAFDLLGPRF